MNEIIWRLICSTWLIVSCFFWRAVPPTKIEVTNLNDDGQKEANAGEELTLTCKAYDAKPAASIKWFRNGSPISPGTTWPQSLFSYKGFLKKRKRSSCHSKTEWSIVDAAASSLIPSWIRCCLESETSEETDGSSTNLKTRESSIKLKPTADDNGANYSCRAVQEGVDSATALTASVLLNVLCKLSRPSFFLLHLLFLLFPLLLCFETLAFCYNEDTCSSLGAYGRNAWPWKVPRNLEPIHSCLEGKNYNLLLQLGFCIVIGTLTVNQNISHRSATNFEGINIFRVCARRWSQILYPDHL